MIYLVRAVLGLSSALASALMLLPPLVAGLIALFDLVARAMFGVTNALLAMPGTLVAAAPGGSLLPWTGVTLSPAETALVDVLRGLPALCMLVVALRPALLRGVVRRVVFDVLVVLALLGLGLPQAVLLLPGALAGVVLQLMLRRRPQIM